MSVLVGASLGGLSLLPVFPDTALDVPWTRVFDPSAFGYGAQFHWYELLASTLIAGVACTLVVMGRILVEALSFAVAAIGGAVTVFSAFGPYFSGPVQTYLGWSIPVVIAVGAFALASRWLVRLHLLLRPPRPMNKEGTGASSQSSGAMASSELSASRDSRADPRRAVAYDRSPGGGKSAASTGADTHRTWPAILVLIVSLFAVLSCAVTLAYVRFGEPLFFALICVFVIAAVALSATTVVFLNRWKSRKTAVAALVSAGVLTGLLFAFLALRPEAPAAEARVEPSHSTETEPPQMTSASPTPASQSPFPSSTPTLVSESATSRSSQGSVALLGANSSKIDSWGMRIAAKSVFSTWADVRLTTDENVCEATLHVGEAVVMTNRQSGSDDYDTWYEVVLESIENYEATFAWSVGTGRAPAADSQDSCI